MWDELRNRIRRPLRTLNGRVLKTALVLGLTIPLLQGCGALLLGGVVVGGASVVHDRRTTRTLLEDGHIKRSAAQLLSEAPDIKMHSRIAITSYNHLVLLTGQAETRQVRDRFARKVARLPKVKKMVNEVTIGPPARLTREGEDALITLRVKLALAKIDIPGFDTTRVKVVTEAGTVFLMGLVYPGEGKAAAEKARHVPGVTKVVKVFEYIES